MVDTPSTQSATVVMPRKGDPLADAPLPHPAPAQAKHQLESFLGGKGPPRPQEVPWPISPVVVLEFLTLKVAQKSLSVAQAAKIPTLVEAYLLTPFGAVARKSFAVAVPKPEAIMVDAYLVKAVGRVGTTDDVAESVKHYERLVAAAVHPEPLGTLAEAREALGPVARSASLAAALDKAAASLLASEDSDDQVEGRQLQSLRNNTLQDIDWADKAKARITGLEKPEPRLAALLEIYFERTDDGGMEYLTPWSVLQIRFHAHRHGAQAVIDAFRREIDRNKDERDQDADAAFATMRSLRAIDFFDEKLSIEELEFVDAHAGDQIDLLSKERMMPHPHED